MWQSTLVYVSPSYAISAGVMSFAEKKVFNCGKGDKQRHVLLGESSWDVFSAIREGASADDFVFQSRQEVSREGYYKGTRLDTSTVW